LADLFGGVGAVEDDAGVEIDVAGHSLVEVVVGGDFDDGGDGVADAGAAAGGEADDLAAACDEGGDGFLVVAGAVEEVETARPA